MPQTGGPTFFTDEEFTQRPCRRKSSHAETEGRGRHLVLRFGFLAPVCCGTINKDHLQDPFFGFCDNLMTYRVRVRVCLWVWGGTGVQHCTGHKVSCAKCMGGRKRDVRSQLAWPGP